MKRIIASGIGVLALGAFFAYQPVAGGSVGGGGLTRAPQQPQLSQLPSEENSLTSTPTPTLVPTPTPVEQSNSAKALTSTPPQITGGPGGDDEDYEDDEYGDREHHSEDHDDDYDEFESDDD